MSGGAWERVMGVLAFNEDGTPMSGNSMTINSGFTGKVYENGNYTDFKNSAKPLAFPDPKYYNLYKVGTTRQKMPASSTLSNSQKACSGGVCYGQALSETSGWYGDYTGFVYRGYPWSGRGGNYIYTISAGVFGSGDSDGYAISNGSSRFVLTP